MEGVVHSLKKYLKSSKQCSCLLCLILSSGQKCACDSTAITCGKSCSIEIYINNTYIYIKMFTVWICIECLHRILKSELL